MGEPAPWDSWGSFSDVSNNSASFNIDVGPTSADVGNQVKSNDTNTISVLEDQSTATHLDIILDTLHLFHLVHLVHLFLQAQEEDAHHANTQKTHHPIRVQEMDTIHSVQKRKMRKKKSNMSVL